jgi:hypothetical protein
MVVLLQRPTFSCAFLVGKIKTVYQYRKYPRLFFIGYNDDEDDASVNGRHRGNILLTTTTRCTKPRRWSNDTFVATIHHLILQVHDTDPRWTQWGGKKGIPIQIWHYFLERFRESCQSCRTQDRPGGISERKYSSMDGYHGEQSCEQVYEEQRPCWLVA